MQNAKNKDLTPKSLTLGQFLTSEIFAPYHKNVMIMSTWTMSPRDNF